MGDQFGTNCIQIGQIRSLRVDKWHHFRLFGQTRRYSGAKWERCICRGGVKWERFICRGGVKWERFICRGGVKWDTSGGTEGSIVRGSGAAVC